MLANLGNVIPAGYAYSEKVIAPRPALGVNGAHLKWYDLHPPDDPIEDARLAEARAFVAQDLGVALREGGDSTGEYRAIEFEGSHRATYRVWELGVVWHERSAWVRFIESARDEDAKRAYLEDRTLGRI